MTPATTLVLDSEGLSRLINRDPTVTAWLLAAEAEHTQVITSAATLVEARNPKTPQPRFDFAVSRIHVEPVTEEIARSASKLLAAANRHGHKYALGALLSATALQRLGQPAILTSDPEDFAMLCGPRVRVIKL
jgi:predicted nucleic acid-binding protein